MNLVEAKRNFTLFVEAGEYRLARVMLVRIRFLAENEEDVYEANVMEQLLNQLESEEVNVCQSFCGSYFKNLRIPVYRTDEEIMEIAKAITEQCLYRAKVIGYAVETVSVTHTAYNSPIITDEEQRIIYISWKNSR